MNRKGLEAGSRCRSGEVGGCIAGNVRQEHFRDWWLRRCIVLVEGVLVLLFTLLLAKVCFGQFEGAADDIESLSEVTCRGSNFSGCELNGSWMHQIKVNCLQAGCDNGGNLRSSVWFERKKDWRKILSFETGEEARG